jgi:hypothetical protein
LLPILAIFTIPRSVVIFPSEARSPFYIGRTLGDAGRLLTRHWLSLLMAFLLLRMLPRVIIGEDMDAGLVGNGRSFVAELLEPLGEVWGNFVAVQIMDVPDYLFGAAATVILLRDAIRPKWFGLLPALLLALLWFAMMLIVEVQPLLFELPSFGSGLLLLFLLPIYLMLSVSDAAAVAEYRWPVSAFGRSIKLVRKGPFRLLVLLMVVGLLYIVSDMAESLLLTAIPVTDANWFDWVTTMLQECISGFYLPFGSAILVAAFLHLRRRHDGDKPEDTAAIFD